MTTLNAMPILQRVTCPDDPRLMLEQQMCVAPVSKVLKGRISDAEPERRECEDPRCLSLVTRQTLELGLEPFECDDPDVSRPLLNGVIRVVDLVHVFDRSGDGRAFHSGDFRWESGRTLIFGRLSGITNAGTHHEPVMDCQRCNDPGFLQGQLCGSIARAEDQTLRGAQIFANYALRVDRVAGDGIPEQEVRGTIEGVLVRGCGCC
jgi:hypothetical protein